MIRHQTIYIGTLAAASLLLESTMIRMMAVSQFYHFAFLVISLALLGYGASGSVLYIVNRKKPIQKQSINLFYLRLGFGFTLSVILAYAIINFLPFDSYSIAWDRRQILLFGLYYLALTLPFFMSGLATGAALTTIGEKKHLIYAANLLGSGFGVLVAPIILQLAGVPWGVFLSALLGIIAATPFGFQKGYSPKWLRYGICLIIMIGLLILGYSSWQNLAGNAPLGLILSPYKGLAQALRYPGAERVFGRWNLISRIDVIRKASTHRLPGLSYLYTGSVPEQYGLSVDAGQLQPITLVEPEAFEAAAYLPEALVFNLVEDAEVLILEPGGGLGILQALSGGAGRITAVVSNPLEVSIEEQVVESSNLYKNPKVNVVLDSVRAFTTRNQTRFDIIFFPLSDPYRPIASGAFSLSETFNLTVESFSSTLDQLASGGVLIITRWLQTPPSESIRALTAIIEAAREVEVENLESSIIAYRGIQTMTILLKPSGWDEDERETVRNFVSSRKFDLVWLSDLATTEVNIHNKLPEPYYYLVVKDLFNHQTREESYKTYPFDISPPTDNHPFFYHFFKWNQTSDVIATLGHTWQPFWGSGFLVLFALLVLVVVISLGLVLLPLLFFNHSIRKASDVRMNQTYLVVFAYFTCLGFAFMFIEIPLIQKAILLLGHPITAFSTVVFPILVFSGLGSAVARSRHLPRRLVMVLTPITAFVVPLILISLFDLCLGWELIYRIVVVIITLAPLAFLMGFPFPYGLISLEIHGENIIPWIWSVNGCVSVAASVLAAILVLSYGFNNVLFIGAGMYACASLIFLLFIQHGP